MCLQGYELAAILVHRGANATSGHYVAHIRDALGCWRGAPCPALPPPCPALPRPSFPADSPLGLRRGATISLIPLFPLWVMVPMGLWVMVPGCSRV